jgi:hypothetical protein
MANVSSQPGSPRSLDQVRERICYKHYRIRIERAYVEWVKRFVLFRDISQNKTAYRL